MREDGPQRLNRQRGTQPTLVRALDALRQGTDETARLERVAAKLGALLDAPPPAAPSVVREASSALLRRASFKLILGGLAVLVPAAWMLHGVLFGTSEVNPQPREVATSAQLPGAATRDAGTALRAEAEGASYAAAARAAAPANEAVEQDKARSSAAVKVAVHGRRSGGRLHLRGGETAQGTDRSESSVAIASGTSAGTKPSDVEDVEDAVAAKQADAREQASSAKRAEEAARSARDEQSDKLTARARPPEESQASASDGRAAKPAAESREPTRPAASDAHASEAALLFEARKALPHDAASSLKLLEEHARRYPKGVLVPEREVLAIEALRALGRTSEADARLARFEARYPDSLHLERLRH
jgi:hypothetical protein